VDPGWKKFGSGMKKSRIPIRDKHPGSATQPGVVNSHLDVIIEEFLGLELLLAVRALEVPDPLVEILNIDLLILWLRRV
jgi:hypothetical protein